MAEYEKTLLGLEQIMKSKTPKENIARHASETMKAYFKKKDYDSAMDCMELVLEERWLGDDKPFLLSVVSYMGRKLPCNQLSHRKGPPTYKFDRVFGKMRERINDLNEQGRKVGSVKGLVYDLILTVVLIAALVAIWFVPPVREFLGANLESFVWLLIGVVAVVTFIQSEYDLSSTFVVTLIFVVAAVVIASIGEWLLPEGFRAPTAVTIPTVCFCLALLNSIRRNLAAVKNPEGQPEVREKCQEELDALCRICDDRRAKIERLRDSLQGDYNYNRSSYTYSYLLCKYIDFVAKDKEELRDWNYGETEGELTHELKMMERYYEFVKKAAKAAAPEELLRQSAL